MDAIIARWATPARLVVLAQFFRFGVVGTIGFLVDTAVVYATRGALGLYGAGLLSFLVAATVNWALNRIWTFRGQGSGPAHYQWMRFIAVNSLGFVLNRGTYAVLVTVSLLCAREPVIAVAAGSLAGMFSNFVLSRRLVFR
jgi:putative flippase GtrA